MSTTACPAATMPGEDKVEPSPRLTLKSQLDDMGLLWPWAEAMIARYAIPADTAFGVHLCLEEAISNVIRHGYGDDPGHTVTVDCASPEPRLVIFTIEDQAPPFDPVSGSLIEEEPAQSPEDYLRPGGRGILLMRKFASTLSYERLATGNRLNIGFVLAG